MGYEALAYRSALAAYEAEAVRLVEGHKSRDAEGLELIHHRHPRFLDEKIPWLPKGLSSEEIAVAAFDLDDARLVIARRHDFRDWAALTDYVAAVEADDSPVYWFESAVEAVVNGDADGLRAALAAHPELVHARSSRVTHFDPPVHRSTLLHYVAANGVEGYRQKTPANAVEIAKMLLEAGADVNSLASLYGGECTTLSLLVSSSHPAEAGLQVALTKALVDYGARVNDYGEGKWVSPVLTALVFGFRETAEYLVERGAAVDTLEAAAGLGRVEDVRRLVGGASAEARHKALALGVLSKEVEAVRVLLDVGEDVNRFHPEGFHAHATPLHQAALAGDLEMMKLLVERGARLDVKDGIYRSTPLGWAEWGGKKDAAEWLRGLG